MNTQQISYLHTANAAKLIQFVSTGAGIALGLVATEQHFNGEDWTPAQIAAISLPIFISLGQHYRPILGLKPKTGPLTPIPFTAGLGIGVTAYSIKVNLSPCSVVVGCIGNNQGLFSQCASVYGACMNMVHSPNVWTWIHGPTTTENESVMYCDPTGIPPNADYNLQTVANRICNRLFDLDPYQQWTTCNDAFNLNQQTINEIGQMRVSLFNESECNPEAAYSGIKKADVILFIGISVIFVTFALCLHPLVLDRKTRPIRVIKIDPEKDPILSELGQNPAETKLEFVLNNV